MTEFDAAQIYSETSVVVPLADELQVRFTKDAAGNVRLAVGDITTSLSPQGWDSFKKSVDQLFAAAPLLGAGT
jgi:hypothetical protein